MALEQALWGRITVVIPTWNEAAWLPRLLETLRTLGATSIVVADNASTDGTDLVAMAFGCTLVPGGKPGRGRNLGAKESDTEYLLFVDADVLPSEATLLRVGNHVSEGTADVVCFAFEPMTNSRFVRFCYQAMNRWFLMLSHVGVAHGLTSFTLVRTSVFTAVGGFNESIDPGEDVEFVRRASKGHRYVFDSGTRVRISSRRFSVEYPVAFALKTVMWEGLRLFGSRRSILGYRWVGYDQKIRSAEDAWLQNHTPSREASRPVSTNGAN